METESSSSSEEEQDKTEESLDETPEEAAMPEPEIPERIPTPEAKKDETSSSEEEDIEIKAAAIYVDDKADNLNELVQQNNEEKKMMEDAQKELE